MKIENFDTGLKGQKEVENIIITPEENFRNKQKVKDYLTNLAVSYTHLTLPTIYSV